MPCVCLISSDRFLSPLPRDSPAKKEKMIMPQYIATYITPAKPPFDLLLPPVTTTNLFTITYHTSTFVYKALNCRNIPVIAYPNSRSLSKNITLSYSVATSHTTAAAPASQANFFNLSRLDFNVYFTQSWYG